jgi:hypothetical protein
MSSGSSFYIQSFSPGEYTNYANSGGGTETLTFAQPQRQNVAFTIGGTATAGDVLNVYFENLPGMNYASYTVQATDTPATMATRLAAVIRTNVGSSLNSVYVVGSTITCTCYWPTTCTSACPSVEPRGGMKLVVVI